MMVFAPKMGAVEFKVSCKQCIGCRIDRTMDWATRCVHEAQMHQDNIFATFTYDDQHCPSNGGLVKSHFQDFMKRLRKQRAKKIRYYMCGEYGGKTNRPHYHALLFGEFMEDRQLWKQTSSGWLYRSEILEKLWGHGAVLIGDVTARSAAYVASYCQKKLTGEAAEKVIPETGLRRYERIDSSTGEIASVIPEYGQASLKPGIGASWFDKWGRSDALPRDEIVIDGKKRKVPAYYVERWRKSGSEISLRKAFRDVEYRRFLKSEEFREERTPERLAVRESVAKAGLSRTTKDNV